MNIDRSHPVPHPPPEAAPGAGEGIAAAMAGLDDLDRLPTPRHVAAFERVHAALSDALSSIDGV